MRAGHELASWWSFLSEEPDFGCASCPRSCSKSSILESHTCSDPRTNTSSPPGAKGGLVSAVMCHEPGSCPSSASSSSAALFHCQQHLSLLWRTGKSDVSSHKGTTLQAEPGHSLLSSAVPGEPDFLSHKSRLLASRVLKRRFMCLLHFSLFHGITGKGEGEDRWRKG